MKRIEDYQKERLEHERMGLKPEKRRDDIKVDYAGVQKDVNGKNIAGLWFRLLGKTSIEDRAGMFLVKAIRESIDELMQKAWELSEKEVVLKLKNAEKEIKNLNKKVDEVKE